MRVVFSSESRQRDFVLTEKDIARLSSKHGRNVEVELKAISQQAVPEKTFNGFIRYLDKCLVNTAGSGYAPNCD